MSNDVVHFWSPSPGEQILGMMKFQDVIVVATNGGIYVISNYGQPLPDWQIQKIKSL